MTNEKEVIEERKDVNWITDEYLTHALYLVAEQFICDEDKFKWTEEEYKERADYLMRHHTPIAYSYFFQNNPGDTAIPRGTYDIIIKLILQRRKQFHVEGMMPSGIIIPN